MPTLMCHNFFITFNLILHIPFMWKSFIKIWGGSYSALVHLTRNDPIFLLWKALWTRIKLKKITKSWKLQWKCGKKALLFFFFLLCNFFIFIRDLNPHTNADFKGYQSNKPIKGWLLLFHVSPFDGWKRQVGGEVFQ